LFFVLGIPLVERVRILSHLCDSILSLAAPLDHVHSHDHLSRLVHDPLFLGLLAVTKSCVSLLELANESTSHFLLNLVEPLFNLIDVLHLLFKLNSLAFARKHRERVVSFAQFELVETIKELFQEALNAVRIALLGQNFKKLVV